MAMGLMSGQTMWNTRNCRLLLALWCLLPGIALATDVSVVGLFKGKAVLVIDGHAPRTLAVGQESPEGVKLLDADSRTATIEIGGQRQTITLGERAAVVSTASIGGPRTVTLYPDARGHFMTIGSVNGIPVRFLVDSGATQVVLPISEARRAGIDYLQGRLGTNMTANGPVTVYRLTLASVKVGELELKDVTAEISEAPMPEALLGMSFLGRVSMERNGQRLMLAQRDASRNGAAKAADKSGHARVVMKVQQGHFLSSGSINGGPVIFMVDTGASLVSIGVADARRMGINYLRGEPGYMVTANGRVATYSVKFDEVRVGDIVLHNIDGAVIDGPGLPIALLGMSFLNRTNIERDGDSMSLTQRF
jgi:aspartyl protease family protein